MSGKIKEVNLEDGRPSVDDALRKMTNALTTSRGQGYKAVIMIHGHGSSGNGGSIKTAVAKRLGDGSLRGVVRDYACGDQWISKRAEIFAVCNDMRSMERQIDGNAGMTVVLLRK